MLSRGRAFVASMLIVFAALAPAGAQAAPQDDVRATAQRFVDAMNTGDVAAALSLCSTATVVDQLSPYVFTGPDGCQRWLRAVIGSVQSAGISRIDATLDPTMAVDVSDTTAYIVCPLKFAVTLKGDRALKNAVLTIVLARGADGWKFTHLTVSRPSFTT
jgi:ketosteroid isomerase-like protein